MQSAHGTKLDVTTAAGSGPHTVWLASQPAGCVAACSAVLAYSRVADTAPVCCALLVLQVDQLDAATRTGGGFNQPQYLHLKESISSIIQHLNNLQVGGGRLA